jgi:hypothetical protein
LNKRFEDGCNIFVRRKRDKTTKPAGKLRKLDGGGY